MDTQLWNLFRETGDPMGYLLYRAEKQKERQKKQKEPRKKTEKGGPAPSF